MDVDMVRREPSVGAQPGNLAVDSLCREQQPPPAASLFDLTWIADSRPFAAQPLSFGNSALPRPWPAGLTIDVASAATATRSAQSASSPGASSTSHPSFDLSSASAASATSSSSGFGLCPSANSNTASGSPLTSPASSRNTSPRSRDKKPSMPGRPATKRPVDGGESSGSEGSPVAAAANSGQAAAGKLKLPRLDRGAEDFSSVVKNRLQSYTRTGQACDRCKVRKIRCDALPEGCSHCINLSLECYVTDRVTGRTERRGYMQELEREKNGMVSRIRELEKLLQHNGVQVRPWQPTKTESESGAEPEEAPLREEPPDTTEWAQVGSLWVKNYAKQSSFTPSFPRSKLESRSDTRGTVAGRATAAITSVRGTRLSILGTTIDTTSFPAPDIDEPEDPTISAPLYNKSVQAFLQSAHGINPPLQVDLPSREDAFTYAEWFFMTVASYLPLLHKPSFMTLLSRMYDEPDFKPTAPELVCVHMVFASIYFQYGVRNWQQEDQRKHLNDLSNKHYHFAISKMYHLQCSRDLLAVQCLALIASHTRQFPKPGCGSIVAHLALQRAIDFNLHRNVDTKGKGTNLENELRKRTWWVILMVVVAITGRRGYPVPITVEEFDVDFPEPIADELLLEDGVDTSRTLPCPYEAAIAGFKITPIFMEVFSNMYSVRGDPINYVNVVRALEEQLEQWENDLPESLKLTEGAELDHRRLAALFMRSFALEVRLSLRHPSVAMTADKQMIAENTKICAETARNFLAVMQELQQLRCLDTTWYSMSVCAACIFSMLVAHWECRFETTPEVFAGLKKDMKDWTSILHEISGLLDSGLGIAGEIEKIMEKTLSWIQHDMQHKDNDKRNKIASKAKAAPKTKTQPKVLQTSPHEHSSQQQHLLPQQPAQQQHHQYEQSPRSHHAAEARIRTPDLTTPAQAAAPETGAGVKSFYPEHAMAGHTAYPPMTYGDAQQASVAHAGYQADPAMFYNAAGRAVSVADTSVQANPLMAFASQATQPIPPHSAADYMWQGRSNTWQDWAAAIQESEERYSANALLTLGAGNTHRGQAMDSSLLMDGSLHQHGGDVPGGGQGGSWPMLIFDSNAASTG